MKSWVVLIISFCLISPFAYAAEVVLTDDIDEEVKSLDEIFDYGEYNWKILPVTMKQKSAARLARIDAQSYDFDGFLSMYKKLFSENELKDLWYKVRMNYLLNAVGVNWPTCNQYRLFCSHYENMPVYLRDYQLIQDMKLFLDEYEAYYNDPEVCSAFAESGA